MNPKYTTSRYPRRGERIVPYVLRRFFEEPLPTRFRNNAGDRPIRFSDLDETAWNRFSPKEVDELAEWTIKHIAKHSLRKTLAACRFPYPPADLSIDDLVIEKRTRGCLMREGFGNYLHGLGKLTLGDVFAFRSFGPRCLIDLLTALETPRFSAKGGKSAGKGKKALSKALTAAVHPWANAPFAERIGCDDPRFGLAICFLDPQAESLADLAQRIAMRTQDPPNVDDTLQRLKELDEEIKAADGLTVEAELANIFTHRLSPRNAQLLVGYYGWADGQLHTLQEIGTRFGVTRERVRQVCEKATRSIRSSSSIYAPVMDRVLACIDETLPSTTAFVEEELVNKRFTDVNIRLEAVAVGAELLNRLVQFKVMAPLDAHGEKEKKTSTAAKKKTAAPLKKQEGDAPVVRFDQTGVIAFLASLIHREIHFHGLTTVARLARVLDRHYPGRFNERTLRRFLSLIPGFAWLDEREGWFHMLGNHERGLPKVIEKILAVAGSVSFDDLYASLNRNRQLRKELPPPHVLLAYCRCLPKIRFAENLVSSMSPRPRKQVLTAVESKLVAILQKRGPLMDRGDFERYGLKAGVNLFSIRAFIANSPLVLQRGPCLYELIGSHQPIKSETAKTGSGKIESERKSRRTAARAAR